jgi:hypothetical protein
MSVRAKFLVTEKKENHSTPESVFTITMNPVTSGSPENDQFYKYTPGGQLVLSVLNPDAAAALEVGKQYYIDITPAE